MGFLTCPDPAAAELSALLIFAHLGCCLQLRASWGEGRKSASAESKSQVRIFREVSGFLNLFLFSKCPSKRAEQLSSENLKLWLSKSLVTLGNLSHLFITCCLGDLVALDCL